MIYGGWINKDSGIFKKKNAYRTFGRYLLFTMGFYPMVNEYRYWSFDTSPTVIFMAIAVN